MNKLICAVLAVIPLAVPTAATAQGASVGSLEVAARVAPSDGGAAIELANAYWRSGRSTEAFEAYHRALALNNVMLETKFGDSIWSHEVARRALAHQTTLSAR